MCTYKVEGWTGGNKITSYQWHLVNERTVASKWGFVGEKALRSIHTRVQIFLQSKCRVSISRVTAFLHFICYILKQIFCILGAFSCWNQNWHWYFFAFSLIRLENFTLIKKQSYRRPNPHFSIIHWAAIFWEKISGHQHIFQNFFIPAVFHSLDSSIIFFSLKHTKITAKICFNLIRVTERRGNYRLGWKFLGEKIGRALVHSSVQMRARFFGLALFGDL